MEKVGGIYRMPDVTRIIENTIGKYIIGLEKRMKDNRNLLRMVDGFPFLYWMGL